MEQRVIGFAVSTSLALVAADAMAAAGGMAERVQIRADFDVPADLDSALEAAIAKKAVRDRVNAIFEAIVMRFEEDGQVLSDRYMPDGMIMLAQSEDFTGGVGCYANCHFACHYACHGSRGWR